MQYEVVRDAVCHSDWRAEAIDYEGEGECYVAVFSGPGAEARARDYAAWRNADLSSVKPTEETDKVAAD